MNDTHMQIFFVIFMFGFWLFYLCFPTKEKPRKSGKGWVEYEGKAWFFDWSGDLAYSPIIAATYEPDDFEGVICKACDDGEPIDDATVDLIMEMIE